MKRTKVTIHKASFPPEFHHLLTGTAVYDSSCSPIAQVWFIDRDDGYYLKAAPAGMLLREAEMTRYFHACGWGAELLGYLPGHTEGSSRSADVSLSDPTERDWLLCRRVPGEDATHPSYLARPAWLAGFLGETLRALHESPIDTCPAPDYRSIYLDRVEENYRTGNYDTSHFPDSFGYRSAEEAIEVVRSGRSLLQADTLIHGDYCLPNIMLAGDRLSGLIDLGNGGIADRHIDLFWGAWSLSFNLGTDAYRDTFLDAYGKDRISEEALRVVAACEVFG